MEEISKKKSNKGLIATLIIIIVLLLGCLGFGGYKYMSLQKDNDKLSDENKSISEEINKQNTQSGQVSTTNDYSLFVKQMKEERQKLFNSETSKVDFWESISTYAEGKSYAINMTGDGTLQLVIGEKNTEIAKNVLLYRVVYLGNGAFKSLFYVTEDGSVYTANVEEVVSENVKLKSVKQKSAKEIVAIIPGGSGETYKDENGKTIEAPGAAHPFFVDINGKIYQYEHVE